MIGDGILQQPLHKFKTWETNLDIKIPLGLAPLSNKTEDWIYPVLFCAIRLVNDGQERNEDGMFVKINLEADVHTWRIA